MRVHDLEHVGSTNDEALRLAREGNGLPLCVRARTQSSGRGRRGRRWESPGGGVWLSVVGVASGPLVGSVVLRTALVVRRAIVSATGDGCSSRLRIKWPNDVLLDGRKVAGVLCEHHAVGSDELIVIGVGVNADFDDGALPDGLRLPSTTLRSSLGRAADPDGIARALVEGLEDVLRRAHEPLAPGELDRVRRALAYRRGRVRLHDVDGATREGVLVGVLEDGRAQLEIGGSSLGVMAGEIDALRVAD